MVIECLECGHGRIRSTSTPTIAVPQATMPRIQSSNTAPFLYLSCRNRTRVKTKQNKTQHFTCEKNIYIRTDTPIHLLSCISVYPHFFLSFLHVSFSSPTLRYHHPAPFLTTTNSNSTSENTWKERGEEKIKTDTVCLFLFFPTIRHSFIFNLSCLNSDSKKNSRSFSV